MKIPPEKFPECKLRKFVDGHSFCCNPNVPGMLHAPGFVSFQICTMCSLKNQVIDESQLREPPSEIPYKRGPFTPLTTEQLQKLPPILRPPSKTPKSFNIGSGGVGTELQKILLDNGYYTSSGCSCSDYFKMLNKAGADSCENNIQKITHWLKGEYNSRKITMMRYEEAKAKHPNIRALPSNLTIPKIDDRIVDWPGDRAVELAIRKAVNRFRRYYRNETNKQ